MQTRFKRGDKVVLLRDPNPEYVEYREDEEALLQKGMSAQVNVLLPNGRYHVAVMDKKGKIIAYAPMDEEDLEFLK